MGRQYPRFLYSDPTNTKSEGPFIIHTLYPEFIAKITYEEDGDHFFIDPVGKLNPNTSDEEVNEVIIRMHYWYTGQLLQKANLGLDYYDIGNDLFRDISKTGFFKEVGIRGVMKPNIALFIRIVHIDGTMCEAKVIAKDNIAKLLNRLSEDYEAKYGRKPNWPF